MLTNSKIKSRKPKDKLYKVTDRYALYLSVYQVEQSLFVKIIDGRRETLTVRYINGSRNKSVYSQNISCYIA